MTSRWYALIAALFIAHSSSPAQDSWVKTISTIKSSVVPIVCGYVDAKGKWIIEDIEGTGFFVDRDGRFATASHVLDGLDAFRATRSQHSCIPAIYVPNEGWAKLNFKKLIDLQYFNFITCVRNSSIDIAICTPLENPFSSNRIERGLVQEVEFDTSEIPDGTPEAFTGFPLQRTTPISSVGFVGGKMTMDDSDAWFFYTIDKASWPGASGSPVYTHDGKVIGIALRSGEEKAAGLALVRCAAAIVDFLGKNPAVKK